VCVLSGGSCCSFTMCSEGGVGSVVDIFAPSSKQLRLTSSQEVSCTSIHGHEGEKSRSPLNVDAKHAETGMGGHNQRSAVPWTLSRLDSTPPPSCPGTGTAAGRWTPHERMRPHHPCKQTSLLYKCKFEIAVPRSRNAYCEDPPHGGHKMQDHHTCLNAAMQQRFRACCYSWASG